MSQHRFLVRTSLLAAVAKWTCHDESRDHLNYVLFDGKHMVACDGHRLVAVSLETKLPPFTIHRDDCAALAAAQREVTKMRRATTLVGVANGRAELDFDASRRVMTVKTGDPKTFPPWESLFKNTRAETPEPPAYAFDPRFLVGIDDVISSVNADHRTVEVKAWTAIEAGLHIGPMLFESVVFDGNDGYEMRFLIMPKRS